VTTAGFSRRQVLTFAGLALGVGSIELGGPPTPASAAPTVPQLTLEPVGDHPVAVLSGDSAAPAVCPRQLAIKVVRDGVTLPSGTQLTVTFDPRLFAPVQPAIVTLGGRFVAAASTITTSSTTGLSTCAVTLKQAVPAEGDLVAVMGTAHPLLYPRDLVRRPSDASADMAPTARSARAHRSLQPARPSSFGGPATPWGIELTGGWSRQSWGDSGRFWYYHPVQVTMRSVGPGKVPVPASFAVSVDPRLVRHVAVASVRLNRKPHNGAVRLVGTSRTGSIYQTRWRSSVLLKPGDVLDVRLRVSSLTPSGTLETIKHPVVGLTAMGTDMAQRQTGQNSFTRLDSVWQ
jgi:hypothetical protein